MQYIDTPPPRAMRQMPMLYVLGMTSFAPPTSFLCPGCYGEIFDDWYFDQSGLPQNPDADTEWWSDGILLTPFKPTPRPMVACPLCFAIFSHYEVQSAISDGDSRATLDDRSPIIRVDRNIDNRHLAPDAQNTVQTPNWKLWRAAAAMGELEVISDPVARVLVAESILQSMNDRARAKVRKGQSVISFEDTESVVDWFLVLLAEFESGDISGDTFSEDAYFNLDKYFGVARLNMLVAEIARNCGRFGLAKSHLFEAMDHLDSPPFDREFADDSIYYRKFPNPEFNWSVLNMSKRLDAQMDLCERGDQSLALMWTSSPNFSS